MTRRPASRPVGRGHPRAPRPEATAEATATVRIESIAAGGDGVGRIEGLACFVPRTAPGDLAQIAYVSHARYARGRVLQLLERSPERAEPVCRHYEPDRCGGCQLQHLSRSAQRAVLQRIVRDALHRVGHRDVPFPEIVSDVAFGYRDRLTLTLRRKGSGWIGGLHAFDDPGKVFAVEECPIAHPQLVEAWTGVRHQLRGLPTPPVGSTLRLSLRLQTTGPASDEAVAAGRRAPSVALVVIGGLHWDGASEWATAVRDAVPQVGSVWWEGERGQPTRLSGESSAEVLAFSQVNSPVATALRTHVHQVILGLAPTTVIDAYSGRGDLSEALARDGMAVTAIEADVRATARATERLAAFGGSRVVTGLVEEALPAVLPADVVVLNPPRRGVDIRVVAALSQGRGVRAIVYVSCDPATLARDVSRLPRWRIASLRCFDMFPQTAHVETVCVLTPEDA